MSELWSLGVREAVGLLQQRTISSVELVSAILDRINELDGSLGESFVSVWADEALDSAVKADNAAAAGKVLGPLHGVPVAVKDNIDVAGHRTTAGSAVLEDNFASRDAAVVRRLRRSGAIVVGKANLYEFCYTLTGGSVRNAWDVSRSPGGSSSGSAVAVAARLVPASLGTDNAGSVRMPAALNGIVGVRPTVGRISKRGIVPLTWSLDTVGPLTRSVEDAALLLEVIAGHDDGDPTTVNCPVPEYVRHLDNPLRRPQIAVLGQTLEHNVEDEVAQAVKSAITRLSMVGTEVNDVYMDGLEDALTAVFVISMVEATTYHQGWLREFADDYGEDVRTRLEIGELIPATHYVQAQRFRMVLRRKVLDLLRDHDAVVLPSVPFTARPVEELDVVFDGGVEDIRKSMPRLTALASAAGLPAVSIPCGFSKAGLPIGLQLVGKPFAEAILLRLAHAYQSVTDWHTREPTFASAHYEPNG